jgi:pilus assembly protein CpaE
MVQRTGHGTRVILRGKTVNDNDTILIRIETKQAGLGRKLGEIVRAVGGMQVQNAQDTRRADLLIFELGDDTANEFQYIESLLSADEAAEIFLIAENSAPEVLLQAIRAGAREFFHQPLNEKEVRQALEKFKDRRGQPDRSRQAGVGQIINVIGSKGGVGTTTVAVNLAVSLVEKRSVPVSVALIDMNTLLGEIPLFLELKPEFHWGEITKNIVRLDSNFLMNVLTKHSSGVYVLPSPGHLNNHEPMIPELVTRLIGFMQKIFDFVIVDCGQSMDEASLRVLEMSDTVLLVTLLSLPCLSNTNRLLKSFADLGYLPKERVKIVVNRYLKSSDISLEDAEESIGQEVFWTIPNDYGTTMSAINNGKPLSEISSKAPVTMNIDRLAGSFVQGEEDQKAKWWSFLRRQ